MSQPYKICPICDTPNHRNATLCSTCGTTLDHVKVISSADDKTLSQEGYDHQYGETDLFEGNIRWKGGTYLFGGLLVMGAVLCVGIAVLAGSRLFNNSALPLDNRTNTPVSNIAPPTDANGLVIVTNTPRPTIILATVTLGIPTATASETPSITPTLGPCMQEVQPGDDLISILFRCGHRSYEDLLPTVLALNNLADAGNIQAGQSIQVPWPTATLDPNITAQPTEAAFAGTDTGSGASSSTDSTGESDGAFPVFPTETLQPGVEWHTVMKDESAVSIAFMYGANLRILSELNPEVLFSQCDFGLGSGGPNCTVQLSEGQQLRVPAPTAAPTIQPTPNGSETPTPTATATFNAPTSLGPSDLAFFRADEIVTLRWVATGTLSNQQAYLVRVDDRTSGISYSQMTSELFFIVPEEWHQQDVTRHEFSWSVAVIEQDQPDKPIFVTDARRFTWLGRGSK